MSYIRDILSVNRRASHHIVRQIVGLRLMLCCNIHGLGCIREHALIYNATTELTTQVSAGELIPFAVVVRSLSWLITVVSKTFVKCLIFFWYLSWYLLNYKHKNVFFAKNRWMHIFKFYESHILRNDQRLWPLLACPQ